MRDEEESGVNLKGKALILFNTGPVLFALCSVMRVSGGSCSSARSLLCAMADYDESSTQSTGGETLSEAQKLNTTASKRATLPVMIAASTKGYTCAWCQTLFQHASNMVTGEKYVFRCGGGCVQHYLCSNTCAKAEWDDGHYMTCLRGSVSHSLV